MGSGDLRTGGVLLLFAGSLVTAACTRSRAQPSSAVETGEPAEPRASSAAQRTPTASSPGAAASNTGGPAAEQPPTAARAAACGEDMVAIPAGKFKMGSNDAKNSKYWIETDDPSTFPGLDEAPIHDVSVPSFCIDVTEVTVGRYRACAKAGQCREAVVRGEKCGSVLENHDDHPVDCVTWGQAKQYCEFAGKRLPTEEEWEYAARGTDGRRFPWGNVEPEFTFTGAKPGFCWHIDQPTCSVKQFPETKSPFGVLTMVDNVSEWTSSYECSYATGVCTKKRIARGGSVSGHVAGVRAAYREAHTEGGLGAPRIGFRCAR